MSAITLRLEGVELDPDLQWLERQQARNVAQSATPTIGGGVVVIAQEISAGEEITLQSADDAGWMTKAQVDAVKAMAAEAGGVFLLEVEQGSSVESYSVMFRHHDRPAFDAVPIIARISPDSDDYFRVTIKLMKV